jgi:hypothetical protein
MTGDRMVVGRFAAAIALISGLNAAAESMTGIRD